MNKEVETLARAIVQEIVTLKLSEDAKKVSAGDFFHSTELLLAAYPCMKRRIENFKRSILCAGLSETDEARSKLAQMEIDYAVLDTAIDQIRGDSYFDVIQWQYWRVGLDGKPLDSSATMQDYAAAKGINAGTATRHKNDIVRTLAALLRGDGAMYIS
ncbi:MAG: hypothetical protein II875_09560 [Clostridia bacterium]|nr:hypothetical protein [Clostridia bacterium]